MCARKIESREPREGLSIEQVLELAQEKRELDHEAPVDERLKELPRDIQEDMKDFIDTLSSWTVEHNVPAEKADELVKKEIHKHYASYIDKRFEMPNKAFAKHEIQKSIDDLIGPEAKARDFKKIARLSFDLNGLKAVNDLNAGKHEYGDEYLRRVAGVFKDEDSKIRKALEKQNIKIFCAAEGGDEFGVLMLGEQEIDQDAISQAIEGYNEMINGLDVADLLDFDREEVARTWQGLSEPQWLSMKDEDRAAAMEQFKAEIPKGFEFKATASGGGITLFDAVEKAKPDISKDDSYMRIIEKAMGSLMDTADSGMKDSKLEFKGGLRTSQDLKERFLLDIYSRTEAERELERKNAELTSQSQEFEARAREYEDGLKRIQALIEAGADQATLQKNLAEIMQLKK